MTTKNSLRRHRGPALLVLVFGWLGAPAAGVHFASNMALAEWRVESSVFECRLTHPIEQYGSAFFSRRAGEEQRFLLHQKSRRLRAGEAELVVFSPQWQQQSTQQSLGRVAVKESHYPIEMDWRASLKLITELQEGRRLMFVSPAWHQSEQEVSIVLEPISFRQAFSQYQNCLAGLLPVNYDQISRTAIYFQMASGELPEAELRKLDHLVQYVMADPDISGIFVDGHTDGAGLRAVNLELSRQRAEMVTQYLVDRGFPADKIKTRWHGERYPVASNREPAGRAQNRRVTLRVDRPDDDLPPMAHSAQ